MFPADVHEVGVGNYSFYRVQPDLELSEINIAPCGIDKTIGSKFKIRIMKSDNTAPDAQKEGISYAALASSFPETIWSCELDSNLRPKAKLEASEKQPTFLSGTQMMFRSVAFPHGWTSRILVDQTEPCTMIHNLPFRKFNRPASSLGVKPLEDKGVGIRLIDDDVFRSMRERRNEPVTIDDLVQLDDRKDILRENRNRLNQLAKTTYPPTRSNVPNTTPQQLDRFKQISLTPAGSTKMSHSNHLARATTNSGFSSTNVAKESTSALSVGEPTTSGISYGAPQNTGGLLR